MKEPDAQDLTLVYTLIAFVAGVAAGTLWGQKTGPPKRWMEAEEPPDPPKD